MGCEKLACKLPRAPGPASARGVQVRREEELLSGLGPASRLFALATLAFYADGFAFRKQTKGEGVKVTVASWAF